MTKKNLLERILYQQAKLNSMSFVWGLKHKESILKFFDILKDGWNTLEIVGNMVFDIVSIITVTYMFSSLYVNYLYDSLPIFSTIVYYMILGHVLSYLIVGFVKKMDKYIFNAPK